MKLCPCSCGRKAPRSSVCVPLMDGRSSFPAGKIQQRKDNHHAKTNKLKPWAGMLGLHSPIQFLLRLLVSRGSCSNPNHVPSCCWHQSCSSSSSPLCPCRQHHLLPTHQQLLQVSDLAAASQIATTMVQAGPAQHCSRQPTSCSSNGSACGT